VSAYKQETPVEPVKPGSTSKSSRHNRDASVLHVPM